MKLNDTFQRDTYGTHETITDRGTEYERWDDENKTSHWSPIENGDGRLICGAKDCDSNVFFVTYPGPWTTSAKCAICGYTAEVHTG